MMLKNKITHIAYARHTKAHKQHAQSIQIACTEHIESMRKAYWRCAGMSAYTSLNMWSKAGSFL
jgi:hypothetical protein